SSLKKIFFLATSNQQFCCKFHSKTHFFIFINLEKNQPNISHFISDKQTHLPVANSSLACSIIIINYGFSLKEKDSKSNYFSETIAAKALPFKVKTTVLSLKFLHNLPKIEIQ
ncbi:MAG: hypothetical protein O4965_06305, partial [Trichodesmium sp. St19_bin1]|nr:hypothetical protein [Trichodesmium sp. St19_bin1]